MGSVGKEHREYTRNLEGWPEKIAPLGRAPGMGAIGKQPEPFQHTANGLSPAVTFTHDPLNNDALLRQGGRLERSW
jgi:hypothetical protein